MSNGTPSPFLADKQQFEDELAALMEKYHFQGWLVAVSEPHDNEDNDDWDVRSNVMSEGLADLLEDVAAQMREHLGI